MALTVVVTPALVAVDGETPINAATLNAMANPTVQVTGTIGGSTSVSVDNLTIDQSGSGSSLQVIDAGITPAKLNESAKRSIHQYATGTVSGSAGSEVIAVTLSPAATAYAAGMVVRFKASAAIAGAVDINVNSLGAKNIFSRVSTELAANDILSGQVCEVVYDGTNFQFMGDPSQVDTAQIASSAVTTAKIADSNVTTAKIADSNVTAPKLAAGMVAQVVVSTYNTASIHTTVLPWDNTIPQNTEGEQIITAAITPTSASSTLLVEAIIPCGTGAQSDHMVAALFRDSTANAVAAIANSTSDAVKPALLVLRASVAASATTATTFKLRVGPHQTGTMYVNRVSAEAKFGGVSYAVLTVTEIKG